MAKKAVRVKSKIVALQIQVHRNFVTVNVRRQTGERFDWKVYHNISKPSLRRLALVAESIRENGG
jgi:hypothetical protein